MTAYYNEFDPKAAAWLRELVAGGHIAPGDVDERDIRPDELRGYGNAIVPEAAQAFIEACLDTETLDYRTETA